MTSSGKIYPYYVIDVAAWTIERIFWSDKLLIALNEKLERLKFTIVFVIADKNQRMQKLSNRMFIHPSFTPVLSFALQNFHSSWGEPFIWLRSTSENNTLCVVDTFSAHRCAEAHQMQRFFGQQPLFDFRIVLADFYFSV